MNNQQPIDDACSYIKNALEKRILQINDPNWSPLNDPDDISSGVNGLCGVLDERIKDGTILDYTIDENMELFIYMKRQPRFVTIIAKYE